MKAGLTILVCFLVVTPVCIWIGWKLWMPAVQETLRMAEEGEARAAAAEEQAVNGNAAE